MRVERSERQSGDSGSEHVVCCWWPAPWDWRRTGEVNYCKRQDTPKRLPAVRRIWEREGMRSECYSRRQRQSHRQKGVAAVVPTQRASSLLHARQAARTLDVPHRPAAGRRSAPLGAECALASRALVPSLMPVSHHRRFDRGIWRHPAHCSIQGTLPMERDAHARVSAGSRTRRRRYRMSIFARQRNNDDKMVSEGGDPAPCLYDAYSI